MASFFLLSKSGVEQFHLGDYYQTENLNKTSPFLGFIFTSFSPVLALALRLIFKRKSGINFWKYVIASIYFLGHVLFIWLVFKLFYFPFPRLKENGEWIFVFTFIYLIFAVYTFHSKYYDSKIRLFIKSLLSLVLFLVFLFVIFGLVMSIYKLFT